jgi:hypothetical protein
MSNDFSIIVCKVCNKEFEVKSGIKVLAVYDVEAAKVTGLVNRLIAEKISLRQMFSGIANSARRFY